MDFKKSILYNYVIVWSYYHKIITSFPEIQKAAAEDHVPPVRSPLQFLIIIIKHCRLTDSNNP